MSPAAPTASPDALLDHWSERVDAALRRHLDVGDPPDRLRQAMHYAVFNGGKRLRPLLVHASGLALGVDAAALDAPACAVELIHSYSLVHDDLPAMDDDDLRRGRPTAHLAFDEATAILAGDALQALAFEILASDPALIAHPAGALGMMAELTRACGAEGMAGGQARDLAMEGQRPDRAELEHMFALKTGALIRASVMMPAAMKPDMPADQRADLAHFADCLGLGFQIRDDLLDIEGETAVIGKQAGADQAHNKATWPSLFGLDAARARIDELGAEALACLARVDGDTAMLVELSERLLKRDR